MDEYLKQALEIIKAQASVRTMGEEEINTMLRGLAASIKKIAEQPVILDENHKPVLDPAKTIKDKSITCLECGKGFKILTRKHLAAHGLTLSEYRDKYGFKKGIPLVCKTLQRERRKKMKEMKLWEKRGSTE